VQSRADLQSELAHGFRDRTGTADRARRPVEARKEAIAGDVELRATEAHELASDDCVVALKQLPPGSVAELNGFRCRTHDVREENRGEDSVRLCLLSTARLPDVRDEPFDLKRQTVNRKASPAR
jgi:hypothetical protein